VILLVGIAVLVCCQKHRHFPLQDGATSNILATTKQPSLGVTVWEVDKTKGDLPVYTPKANDGELSLGAGRSKGHQEERGEANEDRSRREESIKATTTIENSESASHVEYPPPYIPSPCTAVLRRT
jgi:hypothetical protein